MTSVPIEAVVARHPETARRLARKLWNFFITDARAPEEGFVSNVASVYLQNNTNMRSVVRYILRSPWFLDSGDYYTNNLVPRSSSSVRSKRWAGMASRSTRRAHR